MDLNWWHVLHRRGHRVGGGREGGLRRGHVPVEVSREGRGQWRGVGRVGGGTG